MGRKSFHRAAGNNARSQARPNRPSKVQPTGTLTRDGLDELARDEPKEPAPELQFDIDGIRAASNAQAREKHRDMIETLRARLRSKSAKGRTEFQRATRPERGGHER
ncbi:hypothetical protein K3555_13710 [Leisingera sp. M527]|uniref:hypothetical protein n=1 Tax=Leisingera sp. M527 TaxID=2867014 RepID=UPI0021A3BF23|nr:hypothetical protein [Leisingera sp. M527]UWQ31649.1 hypothetical protein K3555_13710 [Leisingera sp. M527]